MKVQLGKRNGGGKNSGFFRGGKGVSLVDKMRRDMAWACVEKVLDMPGFFTMLAEIYKEGYFPCSWKGAHPSGQAVVL